MKTHRIPLAKVLARLRYRTGETVLRRAASITAAQDFGREVIPDAGKLIIDVWLAGTAYARGIAAGGHTAALSEPCEKYLSTAYEEGYDNGHSKGYDEGTQEVQNA